MDPCALVSARTAARAVHRWSAVAAVLIVTTACGVQSSAIRAEGLAQLRERVDGIVKEARAQAGESPQPRQLQQALLEAVPPQPQGYRLGSPSTTDDTARIAFALDEKLDSYGASRGTWILRMCVSVTVPVQASAPATITDTDCSALATRAQEIVTYR